MNCYFCMFICIILFVFVCLVCNYYVCKLLILFYPIHHDSYPLSNLPLPGNTPLQYRASIGEINLPHSQSTAGDSLNDDIKKPRWVKIFFLFRLNK